MTTIKAEVPMADVLTYSQSLTSLTGGRGDYTLAFLRYEEVPSHIAQKVMARDEEGERGVTVVRKQDVQRTCAICHRTMLLGERAVRFTPGGEVWVDVCALCTTTADDHGWIKEGSPTTPIVPETRRRRRFGGLGVAPRDPRPSRSRAGPEPMYRRLSPEEQAMVEAAELFNESAYRRTIAGIAKSLGEARVSLLPLSGVNPEVVITVAWDISWYQYRVSPTRRSTSASRSAATSSTTSTSASCTGTDTSTATAGSPRTSRACRPRAGCR